MIQHLRTCDAPSWGHCTLQFSTGHCRDVCHKPASQQGEPIDHRLVVRLLQVPPVASEGAACCYICDLADTPGRFHPEKAAALGVPKGPMFGRLKGGQAVVLPNGETIQPADVRLFWHPVAHM